MSKKLFSIVSVIPILYQNTNGISCIIVHPPVLLFQLCNTGSQLSKIDGSEVCAIFFDVQKAFDSVPHAPLLQKLADIGINSYLLRWIQSYLMNRKQYVAVEGASPSMLQVLSGVPQGSVLGPLLFLLYLNNVANCISKDSQVNFYADDISSCRQILTLLQLASRLNFLLLMQGSVITYM